MIQFKIYVKYDDSSDESNSNTTTTPTATAIYPDCQNVDSAFNDLKIYELKRIYKHIFSLHIFSNVFEINRLTLSRKTKKASKNN